MPPMPFEYEGRDAVVSFWPACSARAGGSTSCPTRANGQPAFGAYLRSSDGIRHGIGLYVLTLARRPDQRHDPFRGQRAAVVRAAAIAAEPMTPAPA